MKIHVKKFSLAEAEKVLSTTFSADRYGRFIYVKCSASGKISANPLIYTADELITRDVIVL